jgi:hypothetical protein
MKPRAILVGLSVCMAATVVGLRAAQESRDDGAWTTTFGVEKSELASAGRNPYFNLEPGYRLVLAGREDGAEVKLTITVLGETRTIDGVETRVVEERETRGEEPAEISRNYFAISRRTNDVFYFGEDVDVYREGKVVSHEGSWISGRNGARFGLAMPGTPLLGARYYQEQAPGTATDRAEVVGLSATTKTPAGTFTDCLRTEETSPLERGAKEVKLYARGIGLIKDGPCKLVKYGTSH